MNTGKFVSAIMIFVSVCAQAQSQLENDCNRLHGQMVTSWTCPSTGKVRSGPWCEIHDHENNMMVFNGCDADFSGYGTVFHTACVHHDLCYHHEPTTSGLSKADCDFQFYSNMQAICSKHADLGDCAAKAKLYYDGVSVFGASSFACSKVKANYGSVIPNIKGFDLIEQP